MKPIVLKNIILIGLASLLAISCSSINSDSQNYYAKKHMRHGIIPLEPSVAKSNPKVLSPASIDRGKILYLDNCYSCHGEKAYGNGPKSKDFIGIPRNLVAMVKEVPNFRLYVMSSKIEGKMPGWNNVLSDNEVIDIENYIIHLSQQE